MTYASQSNKLQNCSTQKSALQGGCPKGAGFWPKPYTLIAKTLQGSERGAIVSTLTLYSVCA